VWPSDAIPSAQYSCLSEVEFDATFVKMREMAQLGTDASTELKGSSMANSPRTLATPSDRRAIARATDSEAKRLIEEERAAREKKTERLKALRLAKEAREGVTELDRKPAKRKRKPRL
jgi:hypothetical protein